ncbi:bifunctional riboflavin kinase/FAD synthetase [Litoribacter alkaliphilus]|uniref:Riboflavin biosynthesis protein n=1 Tax=Litoribacter ruber TaxID=702568 RepID=A0AAP2G564_9BACT|nr:bifunctional riboflavin kinase/FAD synthetase [Litoribacter alkaliphilus]MBS9525215.1 bifunctional riboflavin kinase/FAD synthetase [Litoribacter alkaliphilus]
MRIYEGLDNLPEIKNAVVTSGTFDGVHLGHQKILSRIREIADQVQGETVLITFWPHPRLVLYPNEHNLRLLSTFEEKSKLLRQFGLDHLVTIPFTKAFSQLTSEEFIQKVLIEKLKTKKLVIGYDHRFGKNREGGFEHLKENIDKYGFKLEEISREDIDQVGISSTKIRKALEEGRIETANEFLGRPYELNGIVIKGQQIGRSIGFPTANIHTPNDYKLIPSDGAYAVTASVRENQYEGMLNIGNRPTVDGQSKTVEVNLFGFSDNLYDERISINFIHYLRPEKKFANLEALKAQLKEDKKSAEDIFRHLNPNK